MKITASVLGFTLGTSSRTIIFDRGESSTLNNSILTLIISRLHKDFLFATGIHSWRLHIHFCCWGACRNEQQQLNFQEFSSPYNFTRTGHGCCSLYLTCRMIILFRCVILAQVKCKSDSSPFLAIQMTPLVLLQNEKYF